MFPEKQHWKEEFNFKLGNKLQHNYFPSSLWHSILTTCGHSPQGTPFLGQLSIHTIIYSVSFKKSKHSLEILEEQNSS